MRYGPARDDEPWRIYMAENMVVPVTGGCPKCGNPNIEVPVDYDDDTIITCTKCGYEAPWAKFFSLTSK
jgi:predicted nucleic-acid-binding Zn-ribbon protein